MALAPLRRLVTQIVFDIVGEEAANRAVDNLSQKMQKADARSATTAEKRAAREQRAAERAEREAEREITRLNREAAAEERAAARKESAAERAARREEIENERSVRAQLRLLDRQSREQARIDRATERENVAKTRAEQRREIAQARRAQREAAENERSLRAQLRLMDMQSRGQARLDRQAERDAARAESLAARKAAAEERAARAQEASDARAVRRAEMDARRIAREIEQQNRRKLASERRTAAEVRRLAAEQDRLQERYLRQQMMAQRRAAAEEIRLAREVAAAHRHAVAESQEALHLMGHFGTALGLLYTGHELLHMADEWAFISATVKNSTTSVNDYADAMKQLFAISQSAGVGMEAPLRLFNQLSANRQENGLSQADILGMTDTVTRGLALNHGTNAQNLRAMRQFDEMLSQGKLSSQHLNSLRVDNPYLANLMARVEGGQGHLDAAVHNRQANLPYIIEMMKRMRAEVDHDWGNVQTTFSMAYQRIRNTAMRVLGELIIDNHTLSVGLNVVTGLVDKLADGIDRAAHAVGGFNQFTHIAALTLATAFGPPALSALIAFGEALLPLVLPWAAMAAGIGTVLLLLDDLYAWVNGRKSIMGMIFGDYAQYRTQIIAIRDAVLHAFGLDHVLDNIHSVHDAFAALQHYLVDLSKDPTAHWSLVQQLHEALTTVETFLRRVGYITGFIEKVDQYDPTKLLYHGIMNHLPDRNTFDRAEHWLGNFGATPLYPSSSGANIHMPITVVTQPGADANAIGNAVAGRTSDALRPLVPGAQRHFPSAFPVAEAGATQQ